MMFSFRSLRAATTVMALATLAACSKKDDATPTPTPAATTGVTYTVDGATVTATTAGATVLGNQVVVSGVSGTGTANKGVLLTLPKSTGTYTLSATSNEEASYLASGNSSDIYDSTSGTIVVTTYSASTTSGASNIAGTFTFTGKNSAGATKTVTNGTFNVKY
ncbi:DUF6252 family protein [Hymenobacter negativus]|uniref:Lipoprotein n=1 Tax=Hymenobacter negativus TaxID=2795026 RepID=A0ABS0QD64_9BACT|nr:MULTISPECIES: DUF6252 family protein [Bacteria]MBH8560567.1 hypothetical protein [Hymenobacter negativus]MBH8570899.1 hypothetical protein [Hymenobacter negativus]MBR7210637.1 hypothetical protein [Microvirga sp. STS02]